MSKVAIFCEGQTDIQFLMTLVEYLRLKKNDIAPYIMGGKSSFFDIASKRYTNVKFRIESDEIERILFVLDADDSQKDAIYGGYKNTKSELSKIITQLGFQDISQIYIMCDPITENGNLESLILSTFETQKRECINRFLDCSQLLSKVDHNRVVYEIYNMLYPNEPYNFDHPNFDSLRTELNNLFE